MKPLKPKLITYFLLLLFASILTGSCGNCDDGNNFEDEESARIIDSLEVRY